MADKHLPAYLRRHPLAMLLFVCVVAWLPGFFTLPPLDRDESRFAQATKQMLETRDFVDIRLGDEARYEKPVGIYWLQAASTAVLGSGPRDQIWTYRVPSLLGALAAVAATFWLVRAFAGVEAAFFAGLLLGLSALLMSEAKIAKTDAVLLASIVMAQAVIMRAYLSARAPGTGPAPGLAVALLGWAAFGLGVLVKGPVIVAVCLASIVAIIVWDRDWRWLARLHSGPGLAVALAIVIAMADRHRSGEPRSLLRKIARSGFRPETCRRAGNAWRASRLLRAACEPHLLAGKPAAVAGDRLRHHAQARAGGALSSRLGGGDMADVRIGSDQASPLRAARLSRPRCFMRSVADLRRA